MPAGCLPQMGMYGFGMGCSTEKFGNLFTPFPAAKLRDQYVLSPGYCSSNPGKANG